MFVAQSTDLNEEACNDGCQISQRTFSGLKRKTKSSKVVFRILHSICEQRVMKYKEQDAAQKKNDTKVKPAKAARYILNKTDNFKFKFNFS